jgi:hypothetical protein
MMGFPGPSWLWHMRCSRCVCPNAVHRTLIAGTRDGITSPKPRRLRRSPSRAFREALAVREAAGYDSGHQPRAVTMQRTKLPLPAQGEVPCGQAAVSLLILCNWAYSGDLSSLYSLLHPSLLPALSNETVLEQKTFQFQQQFLFFVCKRVPSCVWCFTGRVGGPSAFFSLSMLGIESLMSA